MNTYRTIPHELVACWPMSIKSHVNGESIDFHYHDVEEWLEVIEGDICFISAGGRSYPRAKGEALKIPRGEVHRVKVGPNGVKYRMWIAAPVSDEVFAKKLDTEDMCLIQKNLEVPEAEDRRDRAFFEEFLSEKLTFHTAAGKLLNKEAFLGREPADLNRIASDSVRILHKSLESVLVATVVHTQPTAGGPRKSYSNSRLFVKEADSWRCSFWLNYEVQVRDETDDQTTDPGWTEDQALELWRYFAGVGGADKNTMVSVATLLLTLSVSIIGYMLTRLLDPGYSLLTQPVKSIGLTVLGFLISLLAWYVAVLYGGYANRNWMKADEIACAIRWEGIKPDYSKEREPRSFRLNAIARRFAWPHDPRKKLAPVFRLFAWLAGIAALAHLGIWFETLKGFMRK